MTKNELNRFRAVLTARVAELERVTRRRDAIMVERCADQLEEIQAASQRALAVCNLDREFNRRSAIWNLGPKRRSEKLGVHRQGTSRGASREPSLVQP
jgi:hypothetical protein